MSKAQAISWRDPEKLKQPMKSELTLQEIQQRRRGMLQKIELDFVDEELEHPKSSVLPVLPAY